MTFRLLPIRWMHTSEPLAILDKPFNLNVPAEILAEEDFRVEELCA